MAVFFKFNKVSGSKVISAPSALRIDGLAAINPSGHGCVALQLTEELGGQQNLFAAISDERLVQLPELVQQAVLAAPARLVDMHGFIALESMSNKPMISATDMFQLITPGNEDGTCTHFSYAPGYRLPSPNMLAGIRSFDVRSKTSDVIARMEQRGHVFIDLTAKP